MIKIIMIKMGKGTFNIYVISEGEGGGSSKDMLDYRGGRGGRPKYYTSK